MVTKIANMKTAGLKSALVLDILLSSKWETVCFRYSKTPHTRTLTFGQGSGLRLCRDSWPIVMGVTAEKRQ
jgi:hypothetical protein